MLPEQFTERMKALLGEEFPQFYDSYQRPCCRALRMNPLKAERASFLEAAPFSLREVPWEGNGFYYGQEDQPGKHPWHEAGVYYIQEASAMAPAAFLDARPGERVLDLCAAPGGKTSQIGAAMRGEGILFCNEIHPARAKILSENVERMGISNAVVTCETPERLAQRFPGYFDRVLVDAPCSGEGMFRRQEEARQEWSEENVEMCAERQDLILDSAADMVRPGGRLVYSTCTFAPQEDEGSVSRFLQRHPEFSIVPVSPQNGMSGGRPDWIRQPCPGLEGTVRLWPHCLEGEGHYLAVLQKEGSGVSGGSGFGRFGLQRGIPEKDCQEYFRFREETLSVSRRGLFLRFADQLYLAPENLPSLEGLKVLRPGLHLGTLKKGRFEPSHALALALAEGEALRTHAVSASGEDARAWIGGMTLPAEGEKGWYLVTVDGYGLGWGKLAGGILKNHYPKGLRRQMRE